MTPLGKTKQRPTKTFNSSGYIPPGIGSTTPPLLMDLSSQCSIGKLFSPQHSGQEYPFTLKANCQPHPCWSPDSCISALAQGFLIIQSIASFAFGLIHRGLSRLLGQLLLIKQLNLLVYSWSRAQSAKPISRHLMKWTALLL